MHILRDMYMDNTAPSWMQICGWVRCCNPSLFLDEQHAQTNERRVDDKRRERRSIHPLEMVINHSRLAHSHTLRPIHGQYRAYVNANLWASELL